MESTINTLVSLLPLLLVLTLVYFLVVRPILRVRKESGLSFWVAARPKHFFILSVLPLWFGIGGLIESQFGTGASDPALFYVSVAFCLIAIALVVIGISRIMRD